MSTQSTTPTATLKSIGNLSGTVSGIGNLLPASAFDSVHTVKAALDAKPTNYRKMNVAFIGDSWTAGYNGTAANYGYADIISDLHLFASVDKYCKGGSGFLKAVDGTTFYTLAQSLVASGEDYDLIIIVGGINDTETASNLQAAARALGSYLRENTMADILYIPNFTNNTALYANTNSISYGFALECIPTMFEVAGIQRSFPPSFFTADGYHLTVNGYRIYAALIANKLLCGDVDFFTYNAAVTGADIAKVATAASNVTINNCNIYQKGRIIALGIKFTYNPSTITTLASGYAKVFSLTAQYRPAVTYNASYPSTWTEISAPQYGLSKINDPIYQADNGIYIKNADATRNVNIVDEILITFDTVASVPFNGAKSCIMYTNQGNFDYGY